MKRALAKGVLETILKLFYCDKFIIAGAIT